MQAGVCTKQSKSKLQPLNEEDIDDEMSAMQTEVMMLERRVGTGRSLGPQWEEDEDVSFMQSETTVIAKDVRSPASCDRKAMAAETSEEDDEVSLMQTDALAQSGVDRSKILAWDTILAMDVNTEKDEV